MIILSYITRWVETGIFNCTMHRSILFGRNGFSVLVSKLYKLSKENGQNIPFSSISILASKVWKEMSDMERLNYYRLVEPKKKIRKSGFQIFKKTHYNEFRNPNNPIDMSRLNSKWSSLTEEQKSRYKI